MRKDPKEKIISILKDHSEGLTLQEIAKLSGMSRITATKYVHELLGAGIIYQRKIGRVKLCYLKNLFLQKVAEDEILKLLKKKLNV